MADIGYLSVLLAIAAALYAVVANLIGARRRYTELIASGEQAVIAAAGLTSLATGLLVLLFLVQDYQVEYVAKSTSRAMPLVFRFSALWGGQAGSLLFWSWILSLYSLVAVLANRHQYRAIMPYTAATLMTVLAFFLGMVAFLENPFRMLDFVPRDGNGLNPLLQHWAMAIHPPLLYLGFVGTTVPFAFAVGSLVARRTDSDWVRLSRRWTLAVWAFLTLGIMLGGAWAYMVLGWGGYWGWDPVENASFLPWLAGTAFLHSVIVQERRGMLKIWNMVLVGLFFGLALWGTFITRSGVVSSVHSFAQSALGPYFLSFIAFVLLGFLWLLFSRWDDLRSTNQLESVVSREASFLLNNLLFIAITFTVFWGTMFPMISEIVVGDKITVGPPFFNQTTVPIFVMLILLMGIGPMTSWGRASLSKLVRNLSGPFLGAGVVTALLFFLEVRGAALFGFAIVLFVLGVHVLEFYTAILVYRTATGAGWLASWLALFRRNRRRYGGYVVHLGILLMTTGIIASNSFQQERTIILAPSESLTIGNYTVTYQRMRSFGLVDRDLTEATMLISQNGRDIDTLYPAREFPRDNQQTQTHVAIRRTMLEDLYIILAGWDDGGATATFKVYVNPLVNWLWLGGLVVFLGILVAAWPERRRQPVPARVAEAIPAK